jgi:hypothetical protein
LLACPPDRNVPIIAAWEAADATGRHLLAELAKRLTAAPAK